MWLAACTTPPPATVSTAAPAQWYGSSSATQGEGAQLPHGGALTDLSQWWRRHDDPLLVELIDAAEAASSSLASAKSRIAQAHALRVSSSVALLPTLDASASASRSSTQPGTPMGTIVSAGLQSSWEIDLFGGNRASRDAAQARLEGAQASWHDARVSVAAEVANQYYSLRSCEKLLAIARADAASRAETLRITQINAKAGFQAPTVAAQAQASAAEGRSREKQQNAQCDLNVKALVALTAMPEPALRTKLREHANALSKIATVSISSLPAQTLTQRPDLFAAEREIAAASAEVGNAQAQRYPRLSLAGSVGIARFSSGDTRLNLETWSIGPVALTLPLFDGGKRAANVDAARARYEEAVSKYRSAVRQAVKEVEDALVTLQSIGARGDDALVAVEGYRVLFAGTEARYNSGLASLIELEEVRRTRLAAETALASLQGDRIAAWIALYRAAGGGWNSEQPGSATLPDRR